MNPRPRWVPNKLKTADSLDGDRRVPTNGEREGEWLLARRLIPETAMVPNCRQLFVCVPKVVTVPPWLAGLQFATLGFAHTNSRPRDRVNVHARITKLNEPLWGPHVNSPIPVKRWFAHRYRLRGQAILEYLSR